MNKQLRRTSDWWNKFLKGLITVYDPDGWHRDDRFEYEWHVEEITLEEFLTKAASSTCRISLPITNLEQRIADRLAETLNNGGLA